VAELPARLTTLKKLIRLGECFLELRNYDGAFAVYLGLNVASVSRLKKTWAGLSDKHVQAWQRLQAFCSHEHNYRVYRAALVEAQPPTLPFMTIYTQVCYFSLLYSCKNLIIIIIILGFNTY